MNNKNLAVPELATVEIQGLTAGRSSSAARWPPEPCTASAP